MFAPTGVLLASLLLGASASPVLEAAAGPDPSLAFTVDLEGRTFVNKVCSRLSFGRWVAGVDNLVGRGLLRSA